MAEVVLPAMPDKSLASLSRELRVTPNGYRPGRAPPKLLLAEFGEELRRYPTAVTLALDHALRTTAEAGRLLSELNLNDIRARLPEITKQFSPAWIWLWLIADDRKVALPLARSLAGRLRQEKAAADRNAASSGQQPPGDRRPKPVSTAKPMPNTPSITVLPATGRPDSRQAES